jgi:O-antigen/teichoic acid export membrane protein
MLKRDTGRPGIAARGLLWLLAQSAGGRGALFLGQILLARLLSPDDFGTVGLTFTITAVIGSLAASGIDDVLVQRGKTSHLWAWPGFLIDIALGVISGALTVGLAPIAARLYAGPEIPRLAAVIAIAMPLSAVSTIPMAAIRVSLNFGLLAAIGTVEVVATQIASVLLAWYGMGAASFVLPMPFVAAAKAIWLWALVRPRMRRTWPRRQWFYLVRSGFWIWGHRLLIRLITQGDYFILGLFVSKPEVGFYFFAFRLSAQPLQALASNLCGVMFPVLAQSRSRPEEQNFAALKASKMLAVIIFFVACLQAALLPPILHLLFSDRWSGSIPLGQILSIGLAFDAIPAAAAALLSARGEFKNMLYFNFYAVFCFFGLVTLGAWQGGALGVAIGVSIYYCLSGTSYSYFVLRGTINMITNLRLYIMPLALSVISVGVAYVFNDFLLGNVHFMACIVVTILVSLPCYAVLIRICIPEAFFYFKTQLIFLALRVLNRES